MARLPRLAVSGQPHHLMQRGNNGTPIFLDDEDRADWLRMLGEVARAHRVLVHAYALLDAQYQLLVTPADGPDLSRAMQALGRLYVNAFNRRHDRTGTLWEGRFRSGVVEAGAHVIACMRVIETAPVRAGLAVHPIDHIWSSAAHHLGRRRDPLITDHRSYWALGNTPFDRQAAYRAMLDEGSPAAEVERVLRAARQGWALGSAGFLADLQEQMDRPLQPRPRGRPRSGAPATPEPAD